MTSRMISVGHICRGDQFKGDEIDGACDLFGGE